MNRIQNLHTVSAAYFFLFAFLYVAAGLAFRNNWMAEQALFFLRFFDIPLALVSLTYGATSLLLQIPPSEDEAFPPSGWIVVTGAILLFSLVVFVNFAFPSVL